MNKLITILFSTLLFACSSSSSFKRAYSYEFGETNQTSSSLASSVQDTQSQQRIVLYNAIINIVVKNPDSTNVKLTEIAKKFEGYVQSLGNEKSIIRVKASKLNNVVADISVLGKVKSKTISGEDVTDRYTDYQVRLENAYKARDRYLELLAKAENVEAALKVEKELERLNGEIDSLEGKLKRYKHLAEFSTITIYMNEKVKPGILGYIGIGIYKSVKWLFVRN